MVHQWLKKAVLLSFRLHDPHEDRRRARRRGVVGQGAAKFAGWERQGLPRGRLPRRAGRGRAPLGLHRAGRGADAVLRQCRRLGRVQAPWSTPGPRSAPAPRSARTCHISGGAGIGGVLEPLQAGPDDHRGQLLHRRPRRGGRGRHRRRRARCCRWASISASRPRSSTAPPARCIRAGCRPIRWWCRARMPGSRCRTDRPALSLYCAVIVKRVDEKTRAKTSINELLRD